MNRGYIFSFTCWCIHFESLLTEHYDEIAYRSFASNLHNLLIFVNWLWIDYVASIEIEWATPIPLFIHSIQKADDFTSFIISSLSLFLFLLLLFSWFAFDSQCRKCWFDFGKEILVYLPPAPNMHLPNRQFSFTFALINFRCNNITCKTKIGYFTSMIVRY